MYLKSITILGFKSFADKTTLTFQPGITAVVGPNGCGKSNVADAVRWVLGEQSAKALRGGEMADVIFNGTDGRKPLGMAEVSLTIGDVDDAHLKAAGVEIAFNEVTITRRVFRDGGSEYFVNRVACRLKDIQQLFMGTGVGRTSYSIMAQGNITQILSSKPEDRRMVFEEAAGITKYKSQKRETLRKLESTEQNLLRVGDLIREVKRQIGSLQRQAGKARRYKQLSQELLLLDTQLARHQFDVFQTEIVAREASVDQLRADIEAATNRVMAEEQGLTAQRERLTELEHQISASQQRSLELKNQSDLHDNRIRFNEERLLEVQQQHGGALSDIAQAEERRLAAGQELAVVRDRMAECEQTLTRHRQELQSRQEHLKAVETGMQERLEGTRTAQADLFQAAQQLSRVRNEINALDLQKQGNLVRLEKLSSEKIQLEEERSQLEQRLRDFAASVEAERLNVQQQRGTVEERRMRLRDLQQQLEGLARELDTALRQQAEQRSRLAVLEQLQSEHEGFGAGAQAALQQAGQALGSLADRIRVPDQYVPAIECALGQNLQLVLAEQPETARQILTELHAQKRGRASVAALSLQALLPAAGTTGSENGPGEPALRVVEAEAGVQPLLARLLGGTRIVPDLGAATEAWLQSQGTFDFVTVSGEWLSRHGVFTGGYLNGAGNGRAPSSILGRKNQIVELQQQLALVQERSGELSRQKGALQSEQTALQAGLHEAQNHLREREVAIATHEGEVNALRTSHRLLAQKVDTVVFEIQSLASQETEAAAKRAGLAARAVDAEAREREGQEQLATLASGLESLRQERDVATAFVTEARVSVAAQQQVSDACRQQQGPLQQRIGELAQLVQQRQRELESFTGRQAQADAEIRDSRQRIEGLREERGRVNTQTADWIGRRDALAAEVATAEDALRALRAQLGERQQQRSTLEVELAQKGMAVQNLRERVQQKYQVNLDDVRSECITITLADQGAPKVRTLTPEEMSASGAATDWAAVGEQVTALQQRLDEMGPVNLVAIEEYEETEQRYQFLTKQNDDLVNARTQLLDVMGRINTQTREMFVATFNQIRDNFRAMFTEVFGGGKADLRLIDEGDVLESGIEIVARPPGKQLQSISLLSGGEQTMTAVALLFAIYQVKPSPFCVLDELDAPLDESNINRFLRIVQRFLVHSQFVIITHNKRTIGMADVLYGVTMEEQGISRIVSVKFHKTEEALSDRPAAPLVPPSQGRSVDEEEDRQQPAADTLEVVLAK